MNFRARLDRIGVSLARIRPTANPRPMIVVELTDELNAAAPCDTEKGHASRFAMLPRGFNGELPEGVLPHDEWLRLRMKE